MVEDSLKSGSSDYFPPVFREVQSFRNNKLIWVSYVVLIIASAFLIYAMADQHSKNKPFFPLLLPLGFIVLIFFFTFNLRLVIEITPYELRFKMIPLMFKKKVYQLTEIEKCELVVYKPIAEYGGWGIRRGREMWAYNVYGNRGVVVYLRSGKKFLLGSQKPEELARSLMQPL
ncbi:MAG: hypothetical protein ACE14Q_08050 [Acidobacteriota bacterium]